MNTTKLYLIRHGETDGNRTGVLMGSTDTPLNDHGRQQAQHERNRAYMTHSGHRSLPCSGRRIARPDPL